jgi:two-component system CheB/CheR fusion protein
MSVLDQDLNVISANRSFYRAFELSSEETGGRNLTELKDRQWDIFSRIMLLNKVISEGTRFEDIEVAIDFPENRRKNFILNTRGLRRKSEEAGLILFAMEQITGCPPGNN